MTQALAIRDEGQYLEAVGEVRALAERCESIGDAKSFSDKARALQVWAQRQRLGLEKVNLAAAAMLWAKRREGELLVEMRENGERVGYEGASKSSTVARLDSLGVTKHESSEAQALAEIPADDFAALIEEMVPEGRITQAEIKRRAERREREERGRAEEDRLVCEIWKRGGPTCRLVESDLRVFEPGDVDAIITDPPYITADALDLYAALRDFALSWLKPNGAVAFMVWQPLLPAITRAFEHDELSYRWTVAWISGAHESTADYQRRVVDRWKPILVYHRGGWEKKAPLLTDVVNSGRDKEKSEHAWQQTLVGMRQLVRALSRFLDPCEAGMSAVGAGAFLSFLPRSGPGTVNGGNPLTPLISPLNVIQMPNTPSSRKAIASRRGFAS